jgi:hypothetical protein
METPEANLGEGMRWFQGTYTARFNSRHRQGGHVFQGRYQAVPIEGEEPEYFRIASDSIHLNPAMAAKIIRGRKRSSYQAGGLERHDEGEVEQLIQRA